MWSIARRRAMASRGKAGLNGSGAQMSHAQVARSVNPDASGREVARQVREARARRGRGNSGARTSATRQRAQRNGKGVTRGPEAPNKVALSRTATGQGVSGTLVGRSTKTTGDEAGSCRTVTGTEYFSADIFESFCARPLEPRVAKAGASSTLRGQSVTGNEVGRSPKVTGDEPGTCQSITGTEYLSAENFAAYCGIEPGRTQVTASASAQPRPPVAPVAQPSREAPATRAAPTQGTPDPVGPVAGPHKVGDSMTLRGGRVTGTMVGRGARVTGDEPGTCKRVTGTGYVGAEQYGAYCGLEAHEAPVMPQGRSWLQYPVSGTSVGRSHRVTGDEPGTCKTVTGTPYIGPEQYGAYCPPAAVNEAATRSAPRLRDYGAAVTGVQPGPEGLTGAQTGACDPITGTPYQGVEQTQAVCGVPAAAEPNEPDFPRPIAPEASTRAWQGFSVVSPARAATLQRAEGAERITGSFSRADGRVTGAEGFRSIRRERPAPEPSLPGQPVAEAPVQRSPVTGEGSSEGTRITGDDWHRNPSVTGTEGLSTAKRNPSRQGPPMNAMAGARTYRASADRDVAESRVTGASGHTDEGAVVTVSGGARG